MIALNKLSSNSFAQSITRKADSICTTVGNKLASSLNKTPNKDKFISKFLRAVEPTGANNSFITLATLMVGTVIIPRVMTASKRNPNNKEATKDEIKEILFRDCQTVLIILFALKSANSIIANIATKLKGLPMINKPYKKVFDSTEKGLKGLKEKSGEFLKHPIQKLKTIGKNILDTIHPTNGVVALNNDEFISKYSGYSSVEEIEKIIDSLPSQGGDRNKVFNMIMDSIIQEQKVLLEGDKKTKGLIKMSIETANQGGSTTEAVQEQINNARAIKETFETIRKEGYEAFKNKQLDQRTKNILIQFFKDKDNTLVKEAKRLTAILKTMALAVETIYLGFGLPALNQKRLERKYLKDNPDFTHKHKGNKSDHTEIIKKIVKPHEIKLFQQFME